MGLQLRGGNGGAGKKPTKSPFAPEGIEETPEMKEMRLKREAAAKQELEKQKEAQRLKALAYEQRDAARREREARQREEEEIRNNPQLAAEREQRMAAMQAEEERRAKFKAEEEAKIEAERRVQEKKMDQTEALIAAIRAQVEKEKAAKGEGLKNDVPNAAPKKPSSNEKPQYRTISPEEMAKIEEKKRMKAAGIQPAEEPKEESPVTGLGGVGEGPSLSNPVGEGPTLSNPTAGQQGLGSTGTLGGGLGINITDTASLSGADESTIALDTDAINTAADSTTTVKPTVSAPRPVKQPSPVQVVGGTSTIVVDDDDTAWKSVDSDTDELSWGTSEVEPQRVKQPEVKEQAFVDENGDIVSVVPVKKRPVDENDVQSAYNIDFNDDDDDDDILTFIESPSDETSSGQEERRKAEEEARRKAEEEARQKNEEAARRKAEEEARKKAEEEARHKAEEEARRKAEEETRRRAEEEARRRAEEETRKKAEEEARRKAEEETRRRAEEEARRRAEEEARKKAEEETRRRAEEEARKKAEEEARKKAEEEARKKAEEEARKKAEEEARKKAEEEARRKAEEEARKKAEEEARRKAEEEARKKAEEEARRRAEEEAKRKAEEEARRKAEEEAKRKAEEEARKKAEEEARRKAEEEARKKAEEEARRKAEEEAKRKAEEEARRKAEEEAKRKAEEEARRKAEEEAKRKAEEEAEKYRKLAEEAAQKAEEARKALEAAKKAEEAAANVGQTATTESAGAAATAASAGDYSLPVGAEQYLGKYLSVAAISEQIVQAMKYISEHPTEPRNIVILGQYGFGTTAIAEDFARSFHAMGICKTKTIAKIKAGALNRANIGDAISKLQGGCLVVENAGVITNEKLGELYQLVSNPSNDVIVIMTGQIDTVSRIFKDNVVISSQFKHLIQVHRITDMDVFEIAKNHAIDSGYPCDSDAENGLRRRMQEVESGNLDRVLKIVDNAVSKAHNREMGTGEQDHHLISADFE